jgi:diguanylate cyclase (GGDEF)-like protein
MRLPRSIGLALGSLCVASTLRLDFGTTLCWLALGFNAVVWPQLAYWIALRSEAPHTAERRNLVVDAALGGGWVAVMGGNLLPSALLLTMLAMNCLAVGGHRLLLRGLAAQLVVGCLAWWLIHPPLALAPTLKTVIACLPFLVIYPLLIGAISHRLAVQLSRKRAEFARSERMYRETFNAMEAGVVLYDADDRMVLCNDNFRRIYPGVGDQFMRGQSFREMLEMAVSAGLIKEAQGQAQAWIEARLAHHRTPKGPIVRQMPDGTWRRILEQRLPGGETLAFSIDVTELVLSEQALARVNTELAKISETDALTGMANRRRFDRRLAEECARSARHAVPLALLMIDIDFFKRINDQQGHLVGDECLKRVAKALSSCAVRSTDIVCRFGGEEFAILLPHTARKEAIEIAQRCLRAVDQAGIPHPDSPLGPHLTVSIGIAAVEERRDPFDPTAFTAEADQALYRAKRQGRHQVQCQWDASCDTDGKHATCMPLQGEPAPLTP